MLEGYAIKVDVVKLYKISKSRYCISDMHFRFSIMKRQFCLHYYIPVLKMSVALFVSSYDPWPVWETLFIYVTAVNKKLNAVIREQLLLHNCRACSLIVTVQADCVGPITR